MFDATDSLTHLAPSPAQWMRVHLNEEQAIYNEVLRVTRYVKEIFLVVLTYVYLIQAFEAL